MKKRINLNESYNVIKNLITEIELYLNENKDILKTYPDLPLFLSNIKKDVLSFNNSQLVSTRSIQSQRSVFEFKLKDVVKKMKAFIKLEANPYHPPFARGVGGFCPAAPFPKNYHKLNTVYYKECFDYFDGFGKDFAKRFEDTTKINLYEMKLILDNLCDLEKLQRGNTESSDDVFGRDVALLRLYGNNDNKITSPGRDAINRVSTDNDLINNSNNNRRDALQCVSTVIMNTNNNYIAIRSKLAGMKMILKGIKQILIKN